jgi:uncharacterized protein involved in tolerance to divalent cations
MEQVQIQKKSIQVNAIKLLREKIEAYQLWKNSICELKEIKISLKGRKTLLQNAPNLLLLVD